MQNVPESLHLYTIAGSALLAYLAGWLWYAPHFAGAHRRTAAQLADFPAPKLPVLSALVHGIALLCLAYLIALIVQRDAYGLLVMVLVGFIFVQCASGLFNQKSRRAIAAEVGYSLLMFALMSGVQLWAA
ncbi:MAG: DUF1761 domain-containing protein [Oceanospirillaceae bacterium]|nr:DUF1761 domain-containing protein [Oceanospirillaceae bacterium]MCP5349902.1 DUF1761 domain-containing protein [Oceanospirillaceae bacterium]